MSLDETLGTVSVDYSPDKFVATITVDRGRKLNALTLSLLEDLYSAVSTVGASPARVVVLRTAGSRVFSVGADINHFADLGSIDMWRTWISTGHRAFDAIAHLRQPSIAVVDGLAFGGGLELALATDFRIFETDATICLPETGLGTVPGWGGTERLTALVGTHRALEMILTRRKLSADEALSWGIATRVAASIADLDSTVQDLTSALLEGAPVAVQLAKQLVIAAADGAPSALLEALAAGVATATDDLAEGVAAFREKRKPNFTNH